MENLKRFLERNNVDQEQFFDSVLDCFLNAIFLQVCSYLNFDDRKTTFKARIRSCKNKRQENVLIDSLLLQSVHVDLSEEQLNYIRRLIKAHLRKDVFRNHFPDGFKMELLGKQANKCNYCGKEIDFDSSHLDHIIPFKLVGDELDDNYQMLCRTCNLSKKANPFYPFLQFLREFKKHEGIR